TFDAAQSAFHRGDYQIAGRLMRTLDVKMLDPERQARMRELMSVPEMQPAATQPVVAKNDGPGAGASEVPGAPAQANVSDESRQADYLKQVQDLREIKFQKLRYQELETEKQARKLADSGDTEHALQVLEEYLSHLPESGLDPDKTALLRRPLEAKLQQYRTL